MMSSLARRASAPLLTGLALAAAPAAFSQGTFLGGLGTSSSGVSAGPISSSVSTSSTTSPSLIQIFGDVSLTTTTSEDGTFDSVGNNTIEFDGDLTLDPGGALSLAHDFTISLVGDGEVTVTTSVTTTFDGVDETLSDTITVTTPGITTFEFFEVGTFATETLSGTFTGQVSFDLIGATDGTAVDITFLSADDQSLELAFVIPEPGSLLLALGAGSLMLTRRRGR